MGLFGGGNRTSVTDTDVTNVQTTVGFEDIAGPAIYGDGNVVTDHGAIAAALDVGLEALRMGGDANSRALDFAGRASDSAFSFADRAAGRAFDTAGDAVEAVQKFGGTALGEVASIADRLFGRAIDAQAKLTDTNLSGLTSLARQTSESADDRVTRFGLYALAAIVAAFVLPPILARLTR